jgi:hypothetical protein
MMNEQIQFPSEELTPQDLRIIDKAEDLVYEKRTRNFFSVSELNTFLVCPVKHRIKYEYGIKLEDTSKSLVFGDLLHKSIAQYYKSMWKVKTPNLNILLTTFEEETAKSEELLDRLMDSDKAKQSFKMNGLSCLNAFHKKVRTSKTTPLEYIVEGSTSRIPSVELELKVPIINIFSEEKEKITDLYMLSYIDLIARSGNEITIWDHKTTQREWSKFKIKTDIQLPAYAYAFRYELMNGRFESKNLFYQEDSCGYHFILKTKEPKIKIVTSSVEDWRIKLFYELVKQFTKAKEQGICYPTFNYEYYKGCNTCPFHIPNGEEFFNEKRSLCHCYLKGANRDDLYQVAEHIKQSNG